MKRLLVLLLAGCALLTSCKEEDSRLGTRAGHDDAFVLAGDRLVPAHRYVVDFPAAGGTVDLALLSSGMYVAMVTTVMGLVVGIPAYFGYNYLVARIEKLVFQMEANSIAFMDILNQPVQK